MSDPYKTLGVAPSATLEEITRAWREAAGKHHPDKGGDVAKFREARAAFEVLSDPLKREEYDAGAAGNTHAAGLVTEDDYISLLATRSGATSLTKGRPPCPICSDSKEVRVVQAGFWLRKPCPACS